jgi:hypothetical protein
MRRLIGALFIIFLFVTIALCEESWVFFHSDKDYFFESPHKGIPLKPLYQRETYYYDENSVQSSGLLLWKTVRARVKIESWGVYSNSESIVFWEVDCDKKSISKYDRNSHIQSTQKLNSGDYAADAFYRALCI